MMRNLKSILRRHISLLGFLGVLSIWQLAGFLKLLPKFILPTPLEILQAFARDREFLWHHSWATLRVALLGVGSRSLDCLSHGCAYGQFDLA